MRDLSHIQNIIVKVGSSSLTGENGIISDEKMLSIVSQIAAVRRKGIHVVLVSSGAQAAGMGVLGLERKPGDMAKKQALAAIGQAKLMQHYENLFRIFNLKCAQILLNHDDFDNRKRLVNLENALEALIGYDVIPIINENDSLAVDEIKVGDNDTLASMIVPAAGGDLLVLMSDIDGLYNDNPNQNPDAKLIPYVGDVREVENFAKDSSSSVGTGGMITKINAAKMVNAYGCDMAIINAGTENALVRLMDGEEIGTIFDGHREKDLSAKKHWILYRSTIRGQIVVDDGAYFSVRDKRSSLLPKGVTGVNGDFLSGAVVEIVNGEGKACGKGITNYSSDEIRLIMGRGTDEIEEILHYKDYDEVIHANNLVVISRKEK
uniref:glutamate 5-kinase n=1 Tax=Eubacterium cellulosolvens TaxID=29322 RepID=UPI0004884B1A|nr:glutamate 5-kinase [[Eubacterium] cellulosolvens]